MEIKEGAETKKAPFKVENWRVAQSAYGAYCQGAAADLLGIKVDDKSGEVSFDGVRKNHVQQKSYDLEDSVIASKFSKLVVAYDAITIGGELLMENRYGKYGEGQSQESLRKVSEDMLGAWKNAFGEKGEEVAKVMAETQEERVYLLTNIKGEEGVEAIYSLYDKFSSEGGVERIEGIADLVEEKKIENDYNTLNFSLLPIFGAELKAVYKDEGKFSGKKEGIRKIKIEMADETYREYRGGEYPWKERTGIKEFDLGVLEEIKKGNVGFDQEGMLRSMKMSWRGEKKLRDISDNWRAKDGSSFSFDSLVKTSMERVCLNYWVLKEKTGISYEQYLGDKVDSLKKNPGMVIGRDVGAFFSEYSKKIFMKERYREVNRRLLRKYHPDSENPNEDRFKELNEVFDKLDKGNRSR